VGETTRVVKAKAYGALPRMASRHSEPIRASMGLRRGIRLSPSDAQRGLCHVALIDR
jgi:hypothetical protein